MPEKEVIYFKENIMKKVVYSLIFCLSVLLVSCSIGKHLESPVYIYIDGVNNIEQSSKSNKYIDKFTQEHYLKSFNKELEEALKSYNLIAVYSKPNTTAMYFKLDVTSFSMRETYEPKEFPADVAGASPKVYNITTCSVDAGYSVYKSVSEGWRFVKDKSASVSKVEKVNKNRTASQILSGDNKDNSISTYHELDSYVFDDLAKKTARKIAELTSLIVHSELK